MRTALISVANKDGIVEFGQALVEMDWRILSTGGTAKSLTNAGVPVVQVSDYTGHPEMLGGRVKTLHPKIHGGILAADSMLDELASHGYEPIDLVCVDCYPFEQEVAKPGATPESIIEQIDIGGITLLRGPAKNYKSGRIVLCDAADRPRVIEWLRNGQPEEESFLRHLAVKAFKFTSAYDAAIAAHLDGMPLPRKARRVRNLKYGENAPQKPAYLCTYDTKDPLAIDKFKQVEGGEPGAVNVLDIDGALQVVTRSVAHRDANSSRWKYVAVGVKHGNACGAAVGSSPSDVIDKMTTGDPLSLFGGFVMTNFEIGLEEATHLRQWGDKDPAGCLLDGVVAPGFTEDGRAKLRRKDGIQLYVNEALAVLNAPSCLEFGWQHKQVRGCEVVQPLNTFVLERGAPYLEVFGPQPTEQQWEDLLLAYPICQSSNSNTFVAVRDGKAQAIAVGQQDRVGVVTLAVFRATRSGNKLPGAVGCHDSFCPVPDAVEVAIEAGFSVIFITKGGRRFDQVLETCMKAGITTIVAPDSIARAFGKHSS